MKKISVLLSAIVVAALCVTGVSAMEGNDVTAYGTPIVQTTEPQGGGNHDIGVIVEMQVRSNSTTHFTATPILTKNTSDLISAAT